MGTFSFEFRVNRTFRDKATHPVTLPKCHYGLLERHIAHDRVDVDIVADGKRVRGWIYRGTAGFGPYYQLLINNHEFAKLPARCVDARVLSVQVRFEGESGETRIHPAA